MTLLPRHELCASPLPGHRRSPAVFVARQERPAVIRGEGPQAVHT